MKPKDYKNLSEEEKYDTKFKYNYEKAKSEKLVEEIKNLEKMCALDYLGYLNEETKEKLIGLCMDKNLLNSDNETLSGETDEENYKEWEEEEEEEDEEEEMILYQLVSTYKYLYY